MKTAPSILKNENDSEEAMQDVFMTVIRKADTFQGNSAFYSWMYRTCVNTCLMRPIGSRPVSPFIVYVQARFKWIGGFAPGKPMSHLFRPSGRIIRDPASPGELAFGRANKIIIVFFDDPRMEKLLRKRTLDWV